MIAILLTSLFILGSIFTFNSLGYHYMVQNETLFLLGLVIGDIFSSFILLKNLLRKIIRIRTKRDKKSILY